MTELQLNHTAVSSQLPLIALKNTVLFPKTVIPLVVQRAKSIAAMEAALAADRMVLFVTQKNLEDDIAEDDLFSVGTVGRIISAFRLPDGSAKIDVEGIGRARIVSYAGFNPFLSVHIEPVISSAVMDSPENSALMRHVIEQFTHVAQSPRVPNILPEVVNLMTQLRDPEQVIGLIAANLNLDVRQQQDILELREHPDALRQLNFFLVRETEVQKAEKELVRKTQNSIGRIQKEYFLREQLKNIEKELGVDEDRAEMDELKAKIQAAGMPEAVHEKAMKEYGRLAKMPPMSPEVSYIRTYLDWLVELPWNKRTKDKIDLKAAKRILDEDHAGLEKVKDRILEYLAVQKQVGKLKGPILCFYGPPGTGKTSIGKSIARALGRTFVRVSLGGMRDEAEIRGHRRTYVGAMPGRIIQGIHQAKVSNPVFLLDEIDKLGMDFRGDPSAALLEALDPQQNNAFSDHYLEMPYDLSDTLFITTANSLETIPYALRDRLEIIDFPGYTENEKLKIARGFLLPRALADHGLKKNQLTMTDSVLLKLIRDWTREAGVRELTRLLSTSVRKVTRKLVESPRSAHAAVSVRDLQAYLGPERYLSQNGETTDQVGVAMGLAWTPVGGEVLPIEISRMPGKGKLILTGQLGEVMRESAQAALSYARAWVAKNGIKVDLGREDLHIHLPSGAIKKDGPSAGIALTTALVSLLTNRPVRRDIAMTGEVTLRGKVTEIGGLKEKALAALRAGIKTIIIPADNKRDLVDMPDEAKKKLTFIPVKTMPDVIEAALRPASKRA
ncbi:MAG TPA: endopeptidase La [Candidatus Paceibacterota bacterium]|nr:endopeptidase La [Candidatus Paceibacterota bacterium]